MSKLLSYRRAAALAGVAIVVGAVSLPFVVDATAAPIAMTAPPALDGSFASVVDADKPAVVTITTRLKATNVSDDDTGPASGEYRQFFGGQEPTLPGQGDGQSAQGHGEALGSGFIVSPDGVIVTNNHVIENASKISVTLDDGTELPATLVGTDQKSDLAVLKIKASKPLPTVSWGDSDKLRLGDQILAIGNPFGIGTTVTAGIVSARGRDLHSGPYDDFIQIDAPINHGNSGGPLVDREGRVVGINTAIYSPNGGSVGVGFAIPSDEAQSIVAKLEKSGSINHGFLGIAIQPVTRDIANAMGLAKADGALIASVDRGSPADAAGLKPGDIVTGIGQTGVTSPKDLSLFVANLSPGDREKINVLRDGRSIDLDVTIGGDRNGSLQNASTNGSSQAAKGPKIGIGLADLTAEARAELNLRRDAAGAVVAAVDPDQSAAAAGIQPGDVIVSVDGQRVSNASDAKNAVNKVAVSGRKSVLLLIERGADRSFVAVPFGAA